jgi:hypothetical protein
MNRREFMAATLTPGILLGGAEQGFTSLFDGKDLSGWNVQEGPPSAFKVEDGAIVIDQDSNFPTWLRSARQYENFDFRCEFFIQGWSDSGIYIHAPEYGRLGRACKSRYSTSRTRSRHRIPWAPSFP